MKKVLVLLIVAMLFLSASAEPIEVYSFEDNVNWIGTTNLLYIRGENGYYISDISGNVLTEDVYSNGFTEKDDLISVRRSGADSINCMGVLNLQGMEVVPFEYGSIEMFEGKWVVAIQLKLATLEQYDFSSWFGDDVYIIDVVDVYNLNTGAKLSLTRDEYFDVHAFEAVINIEDRSTGKVISYDEKLNPIGEVDNIYHQEQDPDLPVFFYEYGVYGLKKGDDIIIDPVYNTYRGFNYGYAMVGKVGKWGLIDENGTQILPAIYDDILTSYYLPSTENTTGYSSNGYYAVVADGKLGYATVESVSCEPKYSASIMKNNGASALFIDMEGNHNILAADGVETILTGYAYVECARYSGGFIYKVRNDNDDYGLIDWHGNEIFPCKYDGIELSGDGKYALVKPEYKKNVIYELNLNTETIAGSQKTTDEKQENSAVSAVISAVKLLLESDPVAAVELIDGAIGQFASGDSAVILLQGAKALIEMNAVAYEEAICVLLDTVAEMF